MPKKNDRFSMLAYTGAVIDFAWWGRMVFDLAGMRLDDKLPALREHARDRVVGAIDGHSKEQSALKAQGYFVSTQDGLEVASLIAEGFPYQSSIGIFPETVEELKEGAAAQVNGSTFQGPGIIVRRSHCREISFVTLGADSQTSVAALAASAPNPQANTPKDFQSAVNIMAQRGLPIRAAIKAAAHTWPALFQAHLAEIGTPSGYYRLVPELAPAPGDPFEAKVQEFVSGGMTRGQATKRAARDFPDLHQAYIRRAQ
jgi:hypothetical protein